MAIKKSNRKRLEELKKMQRNMDWDLMNPLPTKLLRSCDNNPRHVVYGDPFHLGGREWYCPDCGIEWRASKRTGFVTYYLIDIEGETSVLKQIKIEAFPELNRWVKNDKELDIIQEIEHVENPSERKLTKNKKKNTECNQLSMF